MAGAYGILRRSGFAQHSLTAFLFRTKCQVAGVLEKFLQKPSPRRPGQCHHPARQTREYQGVNQLHRADPGPDRRAQLHIAGAHAAHKEKNSVQQQPQPRSAQTVTQAMPAVEKAGNRNPHHEEWKDQPVRDAPAAKIRKSRHAHNSQNNHCGPLGQHMHHSRDFLPPVDRFHCFHTAIHRPNLPAQNHPYFQADTQYNHKRCARLYTPGSLRGVPRIHSGAYLNPLFEPCRTLSKHLINKEMIVHEFSLGPPVSGNRGGLHGRICPHYAATRLPSTVLFVYSWSLQSAE